MEFAGRSSGNGMAEGFWFGKAVFFKDGLGRRRLDIREEGQRGDFVRGIL